jgi:hypothetical protein
MFKRLAMLAVLGVSCAAGRSAAAGPLTVGDPAPKLEVKEFVKGDAVAGLEKGKVYVVEFWATVQLALAAAQRADELGKGKSGPIADTLARVYFVNGDVAKALELQQRAVEQSKGTRFEEEMKQRLEEYRKAAKK